MTDQPELEAEDPSGDALVAVLTALASPHRLRIIGALARGRQYVSQLAREIGMSRPLLHMHLQRLEAAGLVRSQLELGSDGKAVKYFQVAPFALHITPELLARAAQSLEAQHTSGETGEPRPEEEQ
jgi:DNA-binding transcriptional ArsR family regulator